MGAIGHRSLFSESSADCGPHILHTHTHTGAQPVGLTTPELLLQIRHTIRVISQTDVRVKGTSQYLKVKGDVTAFKGVYLSQT